MYPPQPEPRMITRGLSLGAIDVASSSAAVDGCTNAYRDDVKQRMQDDKVAVCR